MLEKLKNRLAIKTNEVLSSVKLSDEKRNERLEVCRTCEYFHQTQFCKLCGCFMPVKTYLLSSECPKKKWISIQISN